MVITSVMFASPAYDEMVNMRIETLYKPLNAEINIEDFANEYKDLHLAIYNNQAQLIGAIVAKVSEEEDNETLIKRKICLMRQVVVEKTIQGRGLGRDIVELLESMLIQKGYVEARINAHVGAVDFYTKLGYAKHGKEFTENGISQITMKKKIQKKSDKLDKLEAVGNE